MPGLLKTVAESHAAEEPMMPRAAFAPCDDVLDVEPVFDFFLWVHSNLSYPLCMEIWPEHTFNDENHFWDKFTQYDRNVVLLWQMMDRENRHRLHACYLQEMRAQNYF